MNRYRKTRLPGSNADNRNVSGVRRWRNAGFTLLEVLLALSLSVLVIAAIASAIHLNVSVLQRQQVNIEQAQVARNVLMIISGDLRAAFQYKPADVTGLDELSVSQAQIAGIASGADLSETDISQLDPGLPDAGGGDPAAIDPGALASATGQSGASPGMTAGSQSSSGFSGMASNSSSSGANQNIAAVRAGRVASGTLRQLYRADGGYQPLAAHRPVQPGGPGDQRTRQLADRSENDCLVPGQ